MKTIIFATLAILLVACSSPNQLPYEQQNQWENEAIASYQRGDMLSAESALRKLLNANSKDAQSWLLLGNIHLREQRIEAARYAYTQALLYQPDLLPAQNNLAVAYLRLATATLIAGQRYREQEPALLNELLKLQGANRAAL